MAILINPDCRDGKHTGCSGGLDDETGKPAPCPCDCHALCLAPCPDKDNAPAPSFLNPDTLALYKTHRPPAGKAVCVKPKGHDRAPADYAEPGAPATSRWHDAGYGLQPWLTGRGALNATVVRCETAPAEFAARLTRNRVAE